MTPLAAASPQVSPEVLVPVLVAVLAAAGAAALLLPAPLTAERPRADPGRGRILVPLLLPAAVLLAGTSPQVLVLALLAAGGWWGGAALWRRRRERAEAEATSGRVLEACEQLASELGVGQPPGSALARAAVTWPALAGVAESFRVGSDVPMAWREVARRPGAADLRHVAAAWQVSHRTGQGLAEAVDRVAGRLRAAQATRRVVRGELASARATARLVAGLPVLALLMGSGAGGDPLGFLVGHPVGLACLGGGLAFAGAGLWWIEALAADVDRAG